MKQLKCGKVRQSPVTLFIMTSTKTKGLCLVSLFLWNSRQFWGQRKERPEIGPLQLAVTCRPSRWGDYYIQNTVIITGAGGHLKWQDGQDDIAVLGWLCAEVNYT